MLFRSTDSAYICLDEVKNKLAPDVPFLEWAYDFDKNFFTEFFDKLLRIYAKKYNIEHILNFNRDKIISKILIQTCKKKYAAEVLDTEGVTHDEPKMDIKGIEVVRTSTPKYCRDKIMNVIQTIFKTKDREQVMDVMRDMKKEFKKSSIEDISFPRGISEYDKYAEGIVPEQDMMFKKGTPMANRASICYNFLVKKYRMRVQTITNGTKIKFCYVLPRNEVRTNVISYIGKYPKKFKGVFEIDYEKQWRISFQDVVQRFFDALDWGEIDFNAGKLNKFFT